MTVLDPLCCLIPHSRYPTEAVPLLTRLGFCRLMQPPLVALGYGYLPASLPGVGEFSPPPDALAQEVNRAEFDCLLQRC
jgi:hypothetical protein